MEFSLTILGIMLMFSAGKEIGGFIILHSFHIIRAFIGFCVLKRLPRSHDMIRDVNIEENNLGFDYLE